MTEGEMAIWQFEVALQPDSPDAGTSVPGVGSVDGPGAMFRRDDSEVVRAIDAILPRRASWSEDLLLWGEENGHRIHAALEAGRLVEVTARIDLRREPDPFPAQLVDLARSCGAHFRTPEDEDLPAAVPELARAIRHSASFRFVRDPGQFLEDLSAASPATVEVPDRDRDHEFSDPREAQG